MICEDCDWKDKEDVRERVCPFDQDVNGIETLVLICDDCHHERAMDI